MANEQEQYVNFEEEDENPQVASGNAEVRSG